MSTTGPAVRNDLHARHEHPHQPVAPVPARHLRLHLGLHRGRRSSSERSASVRRYSARSSEAETTSTSGRRTFGLRMPDDRAELVTVGEIADAHPEWVRGQKNEGDPFIIAHAKAEGSEIVTEEKVTGPGTVEKNLRIPSVAAEHGVSLHRVPRLRSRPRVDLLRTCDARV